LIPTDIAARLKILLETSVQPVLPVKQLPADLPELARGQRFLARVTEALPDQTFRAVVAGRSLTLALPNSAKPGDTLELVVLDRTPRLITARYAGDTAEAVPPGSPRLSAAGQLIGALLALPANRAAGPATVAAAAPLLAEPAAQPAPIAAALRQTVADSGLFYESHLAQWAAGRMPVAQLMREPQAGHARALAAAPPQRTAASLEAPAAEPSGESPPAAAGEMPRTAAPATAGQVPVDLLPLMQQQFQALGNGAVLWSGQIWPGQELEWAIEQPPERERDDADDGPARPWRSHLRLELPRLGGIEADLTLGPAGIEIGLAAAVAEAGEALRGGIGALRERLEAAGLGPSLLKVTRHEPL
jgi:hypothetical protein